MSSNKLSDALNSGFESPGSQPVRTKRKGSLLHSLSPEVFFPATSDSGTTVSTLVYVSQSVESFSYEEFRELVHAAHDSNKKQSIAGYLLYSRGHFLQLLEGPMKKVAAIWKKIKSDPRHTNCSLVSYQHDAPKHNARIPGMSGLDIDTLSSQNELVEIVSKMLATISSSIILLQTFIQPPILDFLTAGINPADIVPRSTSGLIIFLNIRNMEELIGLFPISETVSLFNNYYETCMLMIHSKRGRIMKFIGDSILAYWPDETNIDLGISAVKDIMMHTAATRKTSPSDSILAHLIVGAGAAFGDVVEGNVGSVDKMDYTLVGDVVNVAARLAKQSITESKYRFLFDESVFDRCHTNTVRVGKIQVKGRESPVTIYSLRDKLMEYGNDSMELYPLPNAEKVGLLPKEIAVNILQGEGAPTNLEGDDEVLMRLTYISERTCEFSEDELIQLASRASEKNKKLEITGLLLVVDKFFIQTLEGARGNVLRVYAAIQQDPRHREVTTVLTTHISSRKYSDWNMRGEYLDPHSEDIILGSFAFFLSSISNSYSLLRCYSQPAVSNALRKGTLDYALEPKYIDGITWVCDVVSFTTICENLPSEEIVKLMNGLFQLAIPLIEETGGRITKLIGDCIVASFPPENVLEALEMSIELNRRISEMRKQSLLHSLIYIGMGMSYGRLFEGPIGSSSSKDFAMIGPSQLQAFDAESATRYSSYCLNVTPDFHGLCSSLEQFEFVKMEKHNYFELVHSDLAWSVKEIRASQELALSEIAIPDVDLSSSPFPRSILYGGGILAVLLAGYVAYKFSQKQKEQ